MSEWDERVITLADFIHRFNSAWVTAASRISAAVLVDMLEMTSPQVLRMWREIDLDAFGELVTWVGTDPAPVWLDCARDFTEYWVHQQQIRDATGRADTRSRLCVRGIEPHEARQRVTVRGSAELAEAAWQIVSIIR